MKEESQVIVTKKENIHVIQINRPHKRNAVDRPTAELLANAFREFEKDPTARCAILHGVGGNFCAGADLQAVSTENGNRISEEGDAPMGISRMALSKPLICAVSGYAVAGGLELSLVGDIRICEESAIFGVFCRRFGVPLIDGGTVRLPRIIGRGPALYSIITGLPITARRAYELGLVSEVVPDGTVLERAEKLANYISSLPQVCMLNDRKSAYEQESLSEKDALKLKFLLRNYSFFLMKRNRLEFKYGLNTLSHGIQDGVKKFQSGEGRSGKTLDSKL